MVAIAGFLKVDRAEKRVASEPMMMSGVPRARRNCQGKTTWKLPDRGKTATAVAAPATHVAVLATRTPVVMRMNPSNADSVSSCRGPAPAMETRDRSMLRSFAEIAKLATAPIRVMSSAAQKPEKSSMGLADDMFFSWGMFRMLAVLV